MKNKLEHLVLSIAVVVLLQLVAMGSTQAWVGKTWSYMGQVYDIKMESGEETFYTLDCSIGDPSQIRNDIYHAVDQWNRVGGMEEKIDLSNRSCPSSGYVAHDDGDSEIAWYKPSSFDRQGDTASTAFVSWEYGWHTSGGDLSFFIKAVDIGLNPDKNHPNALGRTPCLQTARTGWRSVMIHEFGHALGFLHEMAPDKMAMMRTDIDAMGKYCGVWTTQPHPDDLDGGRSHYGTSGDSNDLAVAPWELSKSNGVYRPWPPDVDAPSFICPEQEIIIPYAISNRGTTGAYYDVKFYFSSNWLITSTDVQIAQKSNHSIGAGDDAYVFGLKMPTQVPQSLPGGTTTEWHVGARVLPQNFSVEESYTNNQTRFAKTLKKSSTCW